MQLPKYALDMMLTNMRWATKEQLQQLQAAANVALQQRELPALLKPKPDTQPKGLS